MPHDAIHSEIEDAVIGIIKEIASKNDGFEPELYPEVSLVSLGLDSVDFLLLVKTLEGRFGAEIADIEGVLSAENLRDLASVVTLSVRASSRLK
jgi:acyl carrier protein